ncbi:Lipopolysaccharide-modifying protein [Kalmanozyma brasiliensis GHG001]|uniref:Glycosyl transferase CAP10 domain-containing protein n=1 Tax=Kalmanozyma brasiliensis (strain GHG001) TaxID=1365824 RepID=V5GQB4_KALBG|nr:Lipopolysaccharide-modifying protein [Kalmanozyma brasiliensis GHG001]EST08127.1 Lipopolysaccharide-modifying protein [Kalmanozyma brasiliensis GHG001]
MASRSSFDVESYKPHSEAQAQASHWASGLFKITAGRHHYQLAPTEDGVDPTTLHPSRTSRFTTPRKIVCLLFLLGVGLSALFAGSGAHLHPIGPLDDSQCASVLAGGVDAIPCHITLARRKFDHLVSSQSKTYQQAHDRYVAQYHRTPPPGFDAWFAYAQQNNVTIIDDYGQLEADLLPLRRIPPHILRQRVTAATKLELSYMYTWTFANGNVTTTAPENIGMAREMRKLLEPILPYLPPFTVLQNWDDSQRNCGPRNGKEDVNDPNVVKITTTGDRPDAKAHLMYGCPRSTATTSYVSSDRPSIDMCTQADDWMAKHGILHNRNACINATVPVLSLTKPSSFQDITTASWCYGNGNYRLTGPWVDKIAYADKKPHLYWRGSNTGWNQDGNDLGWLNHRHRLVMAARQMNRKAASLVSLNASVTPDDAQRLSLPGMPQSFTPVQLDALSRLTSSTFDINFNQVRPCSEKPNSTTFCREWMELFPTVAGLPPTAAFGNKFVMDLDGNSMSCRFYRLLDSNSLVFKQTVYVEWHDDRLIPWLHYVPVSMGLEELPMLIDYFANHEQGKVLGEELAQASRLWAAQALRNIDLTVYAYRQMLELAHIIGHD